MSSPAFDAPTSASALLVTRLGVLERAELSAESMTRRHETRNILPAQNVPWFKNQVVGCREEEETTHEMHGDRVFRGPGANNSDNCSVIAPATYRLPLPRLAPYCTYYNDW